MIDLSSIKLNYISYISKVVKHKKISHSYLIEIDNYGDDIFFINIFIKMILFDLSYDEVIHSDNPNFLMIDNNTYPDVFIVEPDGNWIKKSQLKDLQKEYSNKSLQGGKRIYVIRNAECLNASSANTILKFLEEPEDNIIAFLITDNRYHVIGTVLSRCQIISLKENKYIDECNEECFELMKALLFPNDFYIHYNYYLNSILSDKTLVNDYFCNIEKILMAFINYQYANSDFNNNAVIDLLKSYSLEKIINLLNVLEDELPKLKYNVNFKLWLDSMFSKLLIGG